MRVISQDGTMDMPYEMSIMWSEDNGAILLQAVGEVGEYQSFAKYSTEEKAKKAMEMLRSAYTGSIAMFQNVEPTEEVKKSLERRNTEIICASIENQPSEIKFENHQNFYFQFLTEEELE
jgi:hypothetical protein